MRMWMVDPKIMCRRHLLGEHVELHMFVGTIEKGISLDGYFANNLLEPASILTRHHVLAVEMESRGYRHKSPLAKANMSNLPADKVLVTVDNEASLKELIRRCPECAANYERIKNGILKSSDSQ